MFSGKRSDRGYAIGWGHRLALPVGLRSLTVGETQESLRCVNRLGLMTGEAFHS